MSRETYRDSRNIVLGYIETQANGDKVVRDARNIIVGYYQASDNTTRDNRHIVIAKGDMTTSLLR